ncbi:radical SAM protein [Candidatus Bipolaricaulota bacterium]
MKEYIPWSEKTLEESFARYREGKFSILDLELSGDCSLACKYCDSPQRDREILWSFRDIERILESGSVSWLFVCGLGEPLYESNRETLQLLLHLCEKHGIRCSAFTNAVSIGAEVVEWVQGGILHLQVKLDSLDENTANSIYRSEVSETMLRNIETLADSMSSSAGLTPLAASIVPSRENITEIPELVRFCLARDIFPLIGEIEDAGLAKGNLPRMAPTVEEIAKMQEDVQDVLGERYNIPTCPSVISGIHVDHSGAIVVDERTGLSCPWFWLSEPSLFEVGQVSRESTWEAIGDQVLTYRIKVIEDVRKLAAELVDFPIGGCGGNARDLIQHYIQVHESMKLEQFERQT